MSLLSLFARKSRHVIAPLCGTLFVAYFGYHAAQGDRGLLTYLRLKEEIRKAEITRDLLYAERQILERRTRLLRPDSLDPDMLEERARVMLNMGRGDERIIMLQRPGVNSPAVSVR